jgi:aminoglycoside 3-N-acetyltransferase
MSREGPVVQRQEIVSGLRRAGLGEGQTVLVHSSLSAFGNVEGGAQAVIDALLEVVGTDGTLVMPAITISPEFVEAHVRAAMADRIDREFPMFDVERTPTWTGRIAETFRRTGGVARSWHPTHSVSALGARASELVEGHHLHPSCGFDSPYERITRLPDARVLLLGVDHQSSTIMHSFEELAGHEYMLHPWTCRIPFRVRGEERLAATTLHRFHLQRKLGRLEDRYLAEGAELLTHIGPAAIRLCDAAKLREITLAALEADPLLLLTAGGRGAWERMKQAGDLINPPPRIDASSHDTEKESQA